MDLCHNGQEVMQCLQIRQPDVLLLDLQMPGIHGDELTKVINETYPRISILALTNLDQTFNVRNMLLNGALGYLLKSSDPDLLAGAIETVYHGKQFVDPVLKEKMLQESIEIRNISLPIPTAREIEILMLIIDEYTSHEIAGKLHLSHRTVENHRLNLLLKFGVKNTAGLVRKAIQLGLIEK